MAFTDATETVVTYNLNGSQREFNIPFDYLSRSFVQVTVFGENTDKRLVVGDDYNYLDSRTISTVRALGGSDGWKRLQIRRYTSDDRIVDFKDGSVLKSADLNVAVVQALHIAAEGRDGKFDLMGVNSEGNWDALDRKINRLAAGTERRDAVNLGQMQDWSASALNQADRAKREADNAARSAAAAKTSETNAKTSETNAKTSETNSKSSENAAKSSATSASGSMTEAAKSQVAAKTSETNAKASEGAAKVDADRSYREAERAKGYADSMGNAIDIGKVIESINTSTNEVIWKGHQLSKEIGVGYPRVPGAASPATRFGYHNDTAKTPRLYMVNTAGGVTLTFPWENGTFSTKEWTNTMVKDLGNGVSLASTRGTTEIANNDDGNMGFWDKTTRRWVFVVGSQSGANFTGNYVRIKNGNSSGNDSSFEATSPDGLKKVGLWAHNDGRIFLSAYHNASGWSNISLGGVGNGVIATREWVNSQGFVKTAGTKLGPVVTGTATNLGTRADGIMSLSGYEAMMSQVPGNAVFCGVVFSNNGGFRTGAPKWRVIS